MFCPNCGNRLPENVKFCTSCGAKTNSSSENKTISDSFIQRSQVAQNSVGNITVSPTISPTINIEAQHTQKCPACGNELSKATLRECKSCHQKYCSECEICGIACPTCGMPYKSLEKMMCSACKRIFALAKDDKRIIDGLDKDELYSVKQRCTCPVCNRTMYYSGSSGFAELGEYTSSEVLKDHSKNNFIFTTLDKFRSK